MNEILTQENIQDMFSNVERVAHIGSWKLDIKKNHLIWSDEIFRMFEIDQKKFPASYDAFLNAIHPEDRDKVNDAYLNSLESKESYRIEHRLKMKDGTIKLVEECCESTFDEDGNPLISIGTVQDITQRVEAQKKIDLQSKELLKHKNKLQELNTNLEFIVRQRTKKLEETLIELRMTQDHLIQTEKMAALGGLVAGVAHEINTPIGLGITGMSHFLDETKKLKKLYESEQMNEDEFLNYLETAFQLANITFSNLKRTAELVKSFKQISIDQILEEKRLFHLKTYLKEILISIDNRLKKSDVLVNVNCPDNLNINSYPGLFSQIITNLIINSLIHGYKGKANGTIDLEFKMQGKTLKFAYKDYGKGISKDNLEKIFNPFFTTNREEGGSGLGLNILYNIITHQLKGTIVCKSEENHGVEFIMSIPIDIYKDN